MPAENKSIVVTGDGPYVGYLITVGFNQIREATWYDRTKRTKAAIELEKQLIEGGKAKQSDMKAKGAKSGGSEKDCDVLITVKGDKVVVSKPKGRKKTVKMKKIDDMNALKKAVNDVMKAAKDLLAR